MFQATWPVLYSTLTLTSFAHTVTVTWCPQLAILLLLPAVYWRHSPRHGACCSLAVSVCCGEIITCPEMTACLRADWSPLPSLYNPTVLSLWDVRGFSCWFFSLYKLLYIIIILYTHVACRANTMDFHLSLSVDVVVLCVRFRSNIYCGRVSGPTHITRALLAGMTRYHDEDVGLVFTVYVTY